MKKLRPKPCAKRGHLWKSAGRSESVVYDRCTRCNEERSRPPTRAERASIAAVKRRSSQLHDLSHAWEKAAEGLVGYDRMLLGREWAKKHPKRFFVAGVDDAHFCSSDLLFFTHEVPALIGKSSATEYGEDDGWMGISVEYVPQCTGEKPARFFLYPGHVDGLIDTLVALRKKSLTYPHIRRERQWRAKAKAR